ncbi:hypothetical protein ABEB36_008256 [Hypothenemus hampei]|uniref:Uncharacterized protein n=1 Tax=Hypothenemus hampei TaxID=57062 RepID=A0ABD1ELV5_HYPHA
MLARRFTVVLLALLAVAQSDQLWPQLQELVRLDRTPKLTDQLEIITSLLETLKENGIANVTLIGSQNIYQDNGSLQEVRIIELFVPFESHADVPLLEGESLPGETFDAQEVRNLRDVIQNFDSDLELDVERFNKMGRLEGRLFINKTLLMVSNEDFTYLNQTLNDLEWEYVQDIVNREPFSSTLTYNMENNSSSSSIKFYGTLASIEDTSEDVDGDMLQEFLETLVDAELTKPNSVLDTVQHRLEKTYKNWDFVVVAGDPEGFYLNETISVHLNYDHLDYGSSRNYVIYGIETSV